MQKTLRKPEHWQDFENLCKKLWGELWGIPHKIKKHGRLGQLQNGVDVYGIPKGESGHWGIQCKGINDDYLNATLTKEQINSEIEKAKQFLPKLEVFIIATTQSKDATLEQYVREKDIENRKANSFEIILFCWEDIVDLIEENRETLNWYLQTNNFREKYDFDVAFENGSNQITVKPKFLKLTTKYRTKLANFEAPKSIFDMGKHIQMLVQSTPSINGTSEINKSWCSLKITLTNTGNVTLENWYLELKVNEAMKINDGFYIDFLMSDVLRKSIDDNRTLWGYEEDNEFLYKPLKGEPLVQKSAKNFEIFFVSNFDQKAMNISWKLFARDFDKSGMLEVELKPEFKDEIKYCEVEQQEHFKEDSIEIKELIERKK